MLSVRCSDGYYRWAGDEPAKPEWYPLVFGAWDRLTDEIASERDIATLRLRTRVRCVERDTTVFTYRGPAALREKALAAARRRWKGFTYKRSGKWVVDGDSYEEGVMWMHRYKPSPMITCFRLG